MRKMLPSLLLAAAVARAAFAAGPEQTLDLEGAWVVPGYNDVRIPGDSGTDFSLTEDLRAGSFAAFRARYTLTINGRHDVSVLAAPLTMRSDGVLDRPLDFYGATFPEGTPLETVYRFNSYRLTYRYGLLDGSRFRVRGGLTAKVREAAIRVEGGGQSAERTDLGFVPLVHFNVLWRAHSRLHAVIEGDALASPQGRAEDVLVAAVTPLTPRIAFKAGYRILEGGADNAQVYTFSLFHYAVAGLAGTF